MSDTPIQPASGSVTAVGVAAAMALVMVPLVGAWSVGGAAPALNAGTVTAIAPAAASLSVAGVAPTLLPITNTLIVPTVGALALASSASSIIQQQQTPDTTGTVNLLKADSQTGIIKRWPGGMGVFTATGTWGGASVSLQFLAPDGTTFLAAGAATTLTANGAGIFYLPRCKIQGVIANAGASTSITAAAQVVPTAVAGIAS